MIPPLFVRLVVTVILSLIEMHHFNTNTLKTPFHLLHTISKILEDDLKVASQVQPSSPPQGMQMSSSLAPHFGDDTGARRVGVTSGCAWIWSEQSDGAGEASHGRLIAQRGAKGEERGRQGEEAQWVRGVQMVDNNLYMLTTLLPECLIS